MSAAHPARASAPPPPDAQGAHAERCNAVQDSQAQQSEALRAELEHLVHVVSHDLQAPLRAVVGFSELLGGLGQADDPRAAGYLRYVVDGAAQMQRMLAALTEYSRVETRGEPRRKVSAAACARAALDYGKGALAERIADVEIGNLPLTWADPAQLTRVFHALLDNAAKFSAPATEIRLEGSLDDAGASVLSITDCGIGIAPADHARAFELFGRLHTRTEYPGEGAGLALVRRIVQRHRGHVWFEPASPGTVVRFTIPPR